MLGSQLLGMIMLILEASRRMIALLSCISTKTQRSTTAGTWTTNTNLSSLDSSSGIAASLSTWQEVCRTISRQIYGQDRVVLCGFLMG